MKTRLFGAALALLVAAGCDSQSHDTATAELDSGLRELQALNAAMSEDIDAALMVMGAGGQVHSAIIEVMITQNGQITEEALLSGSQVADRMIESSSGSPVAKLAAARAAYQVLHAQSQSSAEIEPDVALRYARAMVAGYSTELPTLVDALARLAESHPGEVSQIAQGALASVDVAEAAARSAYDSIRARYASKAELPVSLQWPPTSTEGQKTLSVDVPAIRDALAGFVLGS